MRVYRGFIINGKETEYTQCLERKPDEEAAEFHAEAFETGSF